MSKLVTRKHSYADILKGSMAQTQNKNQKNPTHEKPVPATVLPNNLDTKTKTSNCTPKEIYVEIIKMSSPSQNNILKGSMAQTQNKNQKNPTHEKPVPATVLPNNLDTKTKTSNCTPKEIYVEIIKMSSPSQNNILKGSMAQTKKKSKEPYSWKTCACRLQQSYPTI